jgi:tellurite resistance protein TerC
MRRRSPRGFRVAWRAFVLVAGLTVLALATLLVFVPGSALVGVPLGLAILASEFPWARRWLDRCKAIVRSPRPLRS